MSQDIKVHLSELMRAALLSVMPDQADAAIALERPKQAAHGDFSCNLAMQLARAQKRNPRELAQLLLSEIPASPFVARCEIAGAGFINFHLQPAAKLEVVRRVLEATGLAAIEAPDGVAAVEVARDVLPDLITQGLHHKPRFMLIQPAAVHQHTGRFIDCNNILIPI